MKCKKLFVLVILSIALLMGLLSLALPHEQLHKIWVLGHFFEVMIPILAVGALLKYLLGDTYFSCHKEKPQKHHQQRHHGPRHHGPRSTPPKMDRPQ